MAGSEEFYNSFRPQQRNDPTLDLVNQATNRTQDDIHIASANRITSIQDVLF